MLTFWGVDYTGFSYIVFFPPKLKGIECFTTASRDPLGEVAEVTMRVRQSNL